MLAVLDDERDRIFGEWLAAHRGALFKVVHAHASTHADREDLFQEIVVQVWRSVDGFRNDSSVITWIYRVALNTAIAWNRRKVRDRQREQPLEAAAGVLSPSSPGNQDPRVEWLYRQVAELAEVERAIALLMLDGFSYREIADIVGISENYVGVKINRIKAWLSARLAKEQDDESR